MMSFDMSGISTQYLTNQLLPSIFSDQIFNCISLGTFLLARRRILLKTYTQNKISLFGKLLLQYQKKSNIKSSVEYLQKAGKYIVISALGCSLIKIIQKGSNIEKKLKIEELLKPILLFKIFQLNLSFGLGLGLFSLISKSVVDENLKQFM